jgi:hypothetical protein
MPESPLLPELARSLRELGTPRDDAGDAAHAAIFTPLLHARASAEGSGAESALSALRGSALAARIGARAVDAAHEGIADPAAARARMAEAEEIIEPLREALLALDAAAAGALSGTAGWEEWIARLRLVFEKADVSCSRLADLLRRPSDVVVRSRWFGRQGDGT